MENTLIPLCCPASSQLGFHNRDQGWFQPYMPGAGIWSNFGGKKHKAPSLFWCDWPYVTLQVFNFLNVLSWTPKWIFDTSLIVHVRKLVHRHRWSLIRLVWNGFGWPDSSMFQTTVVPAEFHKLVAETKIQNLLGVVSTAHTWCFCQYLGVRFSKCIIVSVNFFIAQQYYTCTCIR